MKTRFQYTRLYNDPRWRKLRAEKLKQQPLCEYCLQAGRTTAADTVDHFKPHHGDQGRFWAWDNLRSCCTPCHNGVAAVKDSTGVIPGCNANGEPLDPNHPWYTGG